MDDARNSGESNILMKLHGIFPLTGLSDDWQQGLPGASPFDDGPRPSKPKPAKPPKAAPAPSAPVSPARPAPEKKSGISEGDKEKLKQFALKVADAASKVTNNTGINESTTDHSMTPNQAKEYSAGQKLANTVIKEGYEVRDIIKKIPQSLIGDVGGRVETLVQRATAPDREGHGKKERHDAAVELAEIMRQKLDGMLQWGALKEGLQNFGLWVGRVAKKAVDSYLEKGSKEYDEYYRKYLEDQAREDRERAKRFNEEERKRQADAKRRQDEITRYHREYNQKLLAKKRAKAQEARILERQRRKALAIADKAYREERQREGLVQGPKNKFGIEPPQFAAITPPSGIPQFAPDYAGPRPIAPLNPPRPAVPFSIPILIPPAPRPPLVLTPPASRPPVSVAPTPVSPPAAITPLEVTMTPETTYSSYYGAAPYQSSAPAQNPFTILGGNVLQIPNQGGTGIQTSGVTQPLSYGGYSGPTSMTLSGLGRRRRHGRPIRAMRKTSMSGVQYFVPVDHEIEPKSITPLSGVGDCCESCSHGGSCAGGMSGLGVTLQVGDGTRESFDAIKPPAPSIASEPKSKIGMYAAAAVAALLLMR